MKYKKDFKQFINDIKLRGYRDDKRVVEENLDLLQDTWERCEQVIEATPVRLPTLLGGEPGKQQQQQQDQQQLLYPLYQFNLTQSEMQFLVAYLADGLDLMQGFIQTEKKESAMFWEHCDPEDKDNHTVKYYYEWFNESKANVKEFTRKAKRLGAIQGKLKRQLRKT